MVRFSNLSFAWDIHFYAKDWKEIKIKSSRSVYIDGELETLDYRDTHWKPYRSDWKVDVELLTRRHPDITIYKDKVVYGEDEYPIKNGSVTIRSTRGVLCRVYIKE